MRLFDQIARFYPGRDEILRTVHQDGGGRPGVRGPVQEGCRNAGARTLDHLRIEPDTMPVFAVGVDAACRRRRLQRLNNCRGIPGMRIRGKPRDHVTVKDRNPPLHLKTGGKTLARFMDRQQAFPGVVPGIESRQPVNVICPELVIPAEIQAGHGQHRRAANAVHAAN